MRAEVRQVRRRLAEQGSDAARDFELIGGAGTGRLIGAPAERPRSMAQCHHPRVRRIEPCIGYLT